MAEPTEETILDGLLDDLRNKGVKLEFRKQGELRKSEIPWRDRQPWLEEQGYMLRPRYRPGWQPSWKKSGKRWQDAEDEQIASRSHLLDATRISDGALVMLKLISVSLFPHEIEISTFFSSDEMKKQPQNHCAPLYQVLHPPEDSDRAILVMPYLRRYDDPPFENTNEVLELFQQVFEGVQFMHMHHVAHRDCTGSNLMMDASGMYPSSFHPIRTDMSRDFSGPLRPVSRSQMPPKYYFVDMGLSRKYTPDQLPPKEDIIRGGDKSPPEHLADDAEACDPFPTDVYYVGNMIRKDFFQKYKGLDFLAPLVTDMTQTDPAKRPTMDEVVARYSKLRKTLTRRQSDSRLADRKESFLTALYKDATVFVRGLARRASFYK